MPRGRLEGVCCPNEIRDRRSCLRNLQLMTALDSLSYGLTYRFVPHFVQKMGASQIHVGILMAGLCLGGLVSSEVTHSLTLGYGKRNRLVFVLTVVLLTTLMIASTQNYWVVIIMRIFFSGINQTQRLLLDLLMEKETNENNQDKLVSNYGVLSKWGLLAGPLIGALLCDRDKGFQEICSFSAILTFTNLTILITTIDQGQEEPLCIESSLVENTKKTFKDTIENLKECSIRTNWDLLLVRSCFTGSFLIFITKVGKILKHFFYRQDAITVGCTIVFTTALEFIFNHYVTKTTESSAYPLAFIQELSLFLALISMLLTMLVPCFELFVLLNIPTMFLYSFINNLWLQLFCERNNDALMHLNGPTEAFSRITFPVAFGLAFETVGPYWTLLAFTCLPLLVCWATARWYSRYLKFEKQEEDVDYCGLGEELNCL